MIKKIVNFIIITLVAFSIGGVIEMLPNTDVSDNSIVAYAKSKARMKRWAQKHWHDTAATTSYGYWNNDCTDYASQLMNKGGYRRTSRGKENWKGYTVNKKKWYSYGKRKITPWGSAVSSRYSSSWTTVKDMWTYYTKTKHRRHYVTKSRNWIIKHASVGDVVQFWSPKEGWFHSVVIYRKVRHNVLYTSHSNEFLKKKMTHCNQGRSARLGLAIRRYRLIKMGL